MGHKDRRFGQIVYILVFYNIFSWLLPLDGFQLFIFMCRVYCVTVKTKNRGVHQEGVDCIVVSTPALAPPCKRLTLQIVLSCHSGCIGVRKCETADVLLHQTVLKGLNNFLIKNFLLPLFTKNKGFAQKRTEAQSKSGYFLNRIFFYHE